MSRLEEVKRFAASSLPDDVARRDCVLAGLDISMRALGFVPLGLLGNPTPDDKRYRVVGIRIQDGSVRVVKIWSNGSWLLDAAEYRVLLARDPGTPLTLVEIGHTGPDNTEAPAQPE